MSRVAFLLPLLIGAATSASAQTYGQAYAPAYRPASSDINWAISDWRRLRQSSGYSFADYARFLIANPGWPGETAMRRNAERAMRPGEAPASVVAFFQSRKPTTGNGHARLAEALSAAGRHAEAIAAAREAWASADLPLADEPLIHARFGAYFTRTDHDRRADALLFAKKAQDAARFLPLVSPQRAAAFAARVALQTRSPDAEARYQPLMATVTSDAGLMMDRARYLRDAGNEHAARQLFSRPFAFTHRPANPLRFYEMMLLLSRGAASERQWGTALQIARQIDSVLPPGTELSAQPIELRDEYTSLAWLGGVAAMDALGRPADAIAMFDRYSRGGRSLQVLTKGAYWAGRAAVAAGRLAESSAYFHRAGAYPELFYGQLALERLGRGVPAPPSPASLVGEAQRSAFTAGRLVRATRLMVHQGSASERALFIRALAESLTNDGDRQLAVELGRQIGRDDLAVWVSRAARTQGHAFYVRPAYPTIANAPSDIWSLAHGITRQESSFDRYAVSHAGARGLMQLMPGTAQEQARKMGYGYDYSRLTGDPAYNVMLGSAYFRRLLSMWDGNVPLAVASYNAGYGNVRKWIAAYGDPRHGTDVLRWIERIPFMETKGYVQRVIENSVVYDAMNPASPQRSPVHVSRFLGKSRPG